MSGKVDIFGVKFDNLTVNQIAVRVIDAVKSGRTERKKPLVVFTPNPEIVMEARKDKDLAAALKSADIISADGIGIVWASKYFGKKIKERASGYDIVQKVFETGAELGMTSFFLGGSEEAVTAAASKMVKKHSGLAVKGTQNGYFKQSETPGIIRRINDTAPDLLLVGLGSPKQEAWVFENSEKLNVSAIIVVGGSFDVMSGKLKRAPALFQRLGLEWLYRLIKQPRRIKRMMRLPLFVIEVLVYNVKKYKKHSS